MAIQTDVRISFYRGEHVVRVFDAPDGVDLTGLDLAFYLTDRTGAAVLVLTTDDDAVEVISASQYRVTIPSVYTSSVSLPQA